MVSAYADLTSSGPLFAMHEAIAARLRLAFPPARFNHEILPAALTPPMWSDLTRRTPMVALGFVGIRLIEPNGSRLFRARAEWRVVPVIRNPAGPRARLLGDSQGPGQLGLIQVAIAALHGLAVPDVGDINVTDAGNLYAEGYADEAAALTGVTISGVFNLLPGDGSDIADFLRHAADWAFEADGAAVAGQTINLREAP